MTPERDLLSNGLYSRAFGRSPGEVLGYTMVYLRGLQRTGIMGCLKHFPGIGAGEVDSHDEMPIVNLTHDDLVSQDLAPYIELFVFRQDEDDRIQAVMVSHGGFPRINLQTGKLGGRLEPASINYDVVTKLLRHELGFKHLVLTDDLEMGAITRHCPIEEAARAAFRAGEDMILLCSSVEAVRKSYHALLESFRNGELSTDRLRESLTRIQDVKKRLKPALPFDSRRLQELSNAVAELNKKLNYSYGGKI
jgi:beta-N-acetylhexosaminidase